MSTSDVEDVAKLLTIKLKEYALAVAMATLQNLEVILGKKSKFFSILSYINYIPKIVKQPKPSYIMKLNKDLAYLIGTIYGDGYIKDGTKSKKDLSKDYKISFELTDIEFLENVILSLFKNIITTKSKVRTRQRKYKQKSGILEIRNKEFYLFLTKKIKTHKGPKTRDLKISENIRQWPSSLKQEFVAGYFDTDGGFRGNTIGFSTKTKDFQKYTSEIIKEAGIIASKETWLNKKYNEYYYGIRIKKDNIDKFLKVFKLRNNKKLANINARFSMHGCRSGQTGWKVLSH